MGMTQYDAWFADYEAMMQACDQRRKQLRARLTRIQAGEKVYDIQLELWNPEPPIRVTAVN